MNIIPRLTDEIEKNGITSDQIDEVTADLDMILMELRSYTNQNKGRAMNAAIYMRPRLRETIEDLFIAIDWYDAFAQQEIQNAVTSMRPGIEPWICTDTTDTMEDEQ